MFPRIGQMKRENRPGQKRTFLIESIMMMMSTMIMTMMIMIMTMIMTMMIMIMTMVIMMMVVVVMMRALTSGFCSAGSWKLTCLTSSWSFHWLWSRLRMIRNLIISIFILTGEWWNEPELDFSFPHDQVPWSPLLLFLPIHPRRSSLGFSHFQKFHFHFCFHFSRHLQNSASFPLSTPPGAWLLAHSFATMMTMLIMT